MAALPPWVADYIGLPWRMLGRGRDGADCYGLVRLVLAEQFGLTLPLLDGGGWRGRPGQAELDALARFVRAEIDGAWLPVTAPRPGNLALFLLHGRPIHLGLAVAPDWFLHVQEGHDAAIERFDTLHWRNRLAGVFRHAALSP